MSPLRLEGPRSADALRARPQTVLARDCEPDENPRRPAPEARARESPVSEEQDGPIVVGWRELIAFPEWGVKRIRAKIDTGARTSAIHVEEIEELPGDRVRFELVLREKPERRIKWVEAELARQSRVKPSHGEAQQRLVVRTRIRLGPVEREIEVGLVSRRHMLCRMLLGRTAMEGLLVDPARRYLVSGRREGKASSADHGR